MPLMFTGNFLNLMKIEQTWSIHFRLCPDRVFQSILLTRSRERSSGGVVYLKDFRGLYGPTNPSVPGLMGECSIPHHPIVVISQSKKKDIWKTKEHRRFVVDILPSYRFVLRTSIFPQSPFNRFNRSVLPGIEHWTSECIDELFQRILGLFWVVVPVGWK